MQTPPPPIKYVYIYMQYNSIGVDLYMLKLLHVCNNKYLCAVDMCI